MADSLYEHQVFVNCPFDVEYRSLFEAIVFAIYDCGFAVRSALEITDTSQVREAEVEELSRAGRRTVPVSEVHF